VVRAPNHSGSPLADSGLLNITDTTTNAQQLAATASKM
jgi:hypothetical protein